MRPVARRATSVSGPLIGAFAIGAVAYGGLYTFPALSNAFAAEFGISRTLAVTPWAMFLLVTAIASPLLGKAYDELADRDLLTASVVLLAGGWLAVYLAPDISTVILAYAALHAPALQLAFVGTSTAIARRYAGMSGLALGIAYAGPGIGVAIALPLAGQLIESSGWRSTALLFLAASLVSIVFVWLMTSGPPIVVPARRERGGPGGDRGGRRRDRAAESEAARQASGLHETSGPGAVASAQEPLPPGSGAHPASVRRTLRTRRFWLLFGGAAAIGAFDEGVLQAFLPQAVRTGLGPDFAATALGLQSLAYVVGQVTGGWLSDRFGRRVVGIAAAALVALGVVGIFAAPAGAASLVTAGILAHGAGTGATIAVRSAAFGDVFGGANFGTIFGMLAVAYPIGGTLAVFLGAQSLDRLGTYMPLLGFILIALAAWSLALWVAGPRRRRTVGGVG